MDVEIQSDPELLVTATSVRIRVYQGRNGAPVRDTEAFFADGFRLPSVATIVPIGNDPNREFSVHAELLAGEELIAVQRMISTFVPGRTVTVVLRFTNRCAGGCSARHSCVAGVCEDACFAPVGDELERYNCDIPRDAGTDASFDAPAVDMTGFDANGVDAGVVDAGEDVGGEDAGTDANIDAAPFRCGSRGYTAPHHLCVDDEVALGAQHTCAARFGDGEPPRVRCWGRGLEGATGMSDRIYFYADGSPGMEGFGVVAGDHVTCYRSLDTRWPFELECTGLNPSETVPLAVVSRHAHLSIPGVLRPEAVSVRDGMACGVAEGTLACLGGGDGFVAHNNLVEWRDVQVGATHICGTTQDNSFLCWGAGAGATTLVGAQVAPSRVDWSSLSSQGGTSISGTLESYSVGASHTCFILARADGAKRLYCAGTNLDGELGGRMGGGPSIRLVSGDYVQVSAGDRYTCAITRAGGLDCWGRNPTGQLGNGVVSTTADFGIFAVPAPAEGVWARVFAGVNHTCALTDQHDLYCWGSNEQGQLSINECERGNYPSPRQVITQFSPFCPSCHDGEMNGDETGIDCGGFCEPCVS